MSDTARDHLERAIEWLDALELPSVRRDFAIVEIQHALELLAIPPREATDKMIEAGADDFLAVTEHAYAIFSRDLASVWRAMYDAALAEKEGK